MNVDFPAPGTPLMPDAHRAAGGVGDEREQLAGVLAVVGAGGLEQGDRAGDVLAGARAHAGREVGDVDLAAHPSRSRRSATRSVAARLMTVPGG